MRRGGRVWPLLGLLGGAFWLGRLSAPPAALAEARPSPYAKLGDFARVLSYIENNYVEAVPRERLLFGAIQGMLAQLSDPYTSYLQPSELEALSRSPREEGVIGLELGQRGGVVQVLSSLDGGPAARAGLARGDELLAIDGEPVTAGALGQALLRLRGPEGSEVLLLVRRPGEAARELRLSREVMAPRSVVSRALGGGFGYVRVQQFQERTAREVEAALSSLAGEGAGAGLVLDLRDNPGGLFEEAVSVADLFLSEGVIVSTEGRGQDPEVWYARPKGTYTVPVVVLINGGTASAAEIVAAALHENGRAPLVGEQSFGKGSVQSLFLLEGGSGLKLTVARYYTPTHRSLQGEGLRPDVTVREPAGAEDTVLAKAVERLRAR